MSEPFFSEIDWESAAAVSAKFHPLPHTPMLTCVYVQGNLTPEFIPVLLEPAVSTVMPNPQTRSPLSQQEVRAFVTAFGVSQTLLTHWSSLGVSRMLETRSSIHKPMAFCRSCPTLARGTKALHLKYYSQ